ncbi:MAG: prephenate dehydrogenase [Anaerolineales bacterium]|jgi:prephenate dehydrogenase
MSYQVMIIGLDQVGASIGLALSNAEGDVKRLGYDADKALVKRALESGAIDESISQPRRSIKDVDLLILSLPTSEVEVYLESIGPLLKEGALILDTGGIKSLAFEWASSYLPPDRHFVAATPVVGPASLELAPFEPGEPKADLFQDGLLAISTSPGAPENALAVAINLAKLLGAQPFFIDQDEQDAAIAAIDDLPTLLSAALLHASTRSASWRELQRLAGQTFAFATHLIHVRPPKQAQKRIALNREKVIVKVDAIIEELTRLRSLLAQEDTAALEAYLDEADRSRFAWLDARARSDWAAQEMRTPKGMIEGSFLGNLFGITPRKRND